MDINFLDARKWGWVGVILFAAGIGLILFILGSVTDPVDVVSDAVRSVDDVTCVATLPTVTRGIDPHTQEDTKTCTDGKIIITIRDGKVPVGFDNSKGDFLTPAEVATYVR